MLAENIFHFGCIACFIIQCFHLVRQYPNSGFRYQQPQIITKSVVTLLKIIKLKFYSQFVMLVIEIDEHLINVVYQLVSSDKFYIGKYISVVVHHEVIDLKLVKVTKLTQFYQELQKHGLLQRILLIKHSIRPQKIDNLIPSSLEYV